MMEKETGNGFMKTIYVKPGMDVHIADFRSPMAIEKRFESTNQSLRFYFYLSGCGYWELSSPYGNFARKKIRLADRCSTILYYAELEGKKYWQARHRQFHLCIHLAPSLLSKYLSGSIDGFPADLRAISEGCAQRGFSHEGPLSCMMNTAIQHLLDCPYSGPMKALYIESRAMELIVHKLAQIISPGDMGLASFKFDSHEIAQVQIAREILCRDLERPPTLIDLVRAAGMNHCRLNQGFRQIYGTTVFGYLKQRRLIEAKRLIENESRNVTEAALSVGYSSISSFSNAFYKYFGVRPAACLKKKH
jgi:AraC family transcriptional regulator, transcriptional activator of the genes for pyochelin and ferripyochelin receptors